jgi:ribosomal protein S18 acetylase RimI-like enzyme
MKSIFQSLQVKAVGRLEHIRFNLLHFYFFRGAKGENLLFRSLYVFSWLTVAPYVLAWEMHAHIFRKKRFFVIIEKQVAGVLAVQEKPEVLHITDLAVAHQFRRHGVATYIIHYANKQAMLLDKKWLELSVLKKNVPALRFYRKVGFFEKVEQKQSFIMIRKINSCELG